MHNFLWSQYSFFFTERVHYFWLGFFYWLVRSNFVREFGYRNKGESPASPEFLVNEFIPAGNGTSVLVLQNESTSPLSCSIPMNSLHNNNLFKN